jgi:hypothetical protein
LHASEDVVTTTAIVTPQATHHASRVRFFGTGSSDVCLE